MQHVKQLASGALLAVLAASGAAFAGEADQKQGGRDSEPATRTGSGAERAPRDTTTHHEPEVNPQPAADLGRHLSPGAASPGGAQIEELQRELAARGLYQGALDGVLGPRTAAALRGFQQQHGLPASGALDEPTRRALGLQLDKQPVSGAQTSAGPELQRTAGRDPGAQPPDVSGARPMRSQLKLDALDQQQLMSLQTRLQALGFYDGTVDGVFGAGTRSALQRFFRTQADLAARGVLTDATAGMLGVDARSLDGAAVPTSSPSTSSPSASSPSASPATPSSPSAPANGGARGAPPTAPQAAPPAKMPHPQPSTP